MAREGSPTETGLYQEIEQHLKKSKEPLTCVDVWDNNLAIREAAGSVNKLSDAMGHLWRRGFLKRQPAPKTPHNQAKWAYTWPEKKPAAKPAPAQVMRPVFEPAEQLPAVIEGEAKTIVARPGLEIRDDGHTIEVDLPALTILIRTKA